MSELAPLSRGLVILAIAGFGFVASLAWNAALLYGVYRLHANWRNVSAAVGDPDLGSAASAAMALACIAAVGGLVPYAGLLLQLTGLVWPFMAVRCEQKAAADGFGGPAGPRRFLAVALWLQVAGAFLVGAALAVLAASAAAATTTHSASADTAYIAVAIVLVALVVTVLGAVVAVPAGRFSGLWRVPYCPAPSVSSAGDIPPAQSPRPPIQASHSLAGPAQPRHQPDSHHLH